MRKFKITKVKTSKGKILEEPVIEIVEIKSGGFAPKVGDGFDLLTYPVTSIRITAVEEI